MGIFTQSREFHRNSGVDRNQRSAHASVIGSHRVANHPAITATTIFNAGVHGRRSFASSHGIGATSEPNRCGQPKGAQN